MRSQRVQSYEVRGVVSDEGGGADLAPWDPPPLFFVHQKSGP